MADTNWFDMIQGLDDGSKSSLINIGQAALASGKVSPDQARQTMKAMGAKKVPDDDEIKDFVSKRAPANAPDAASVSMQPAPPPPSPVSMQAPLTMPVGMQQAAGAARGVKGATSSGSVKQDTKGTRDVRDSSVFNDSADTVRNTPEMIAERQGIQAMQDRYDKAGRVSSDGGIKDGSAWIKPMLALNDAQFGTKTAAEYSPPEGTLTQADRASLLEKIQQRRNDYTKTLLQGIKDTKNGSETNNLAQAILLGQNNGGGSTLGNSRLESLRVKAGADFDHDKILTQLQNTNNSLDRATSIMDGKTPVNTKNFNLLQADLINALAPGGAATDSKMNRELISNLSGLLNDIQTRFGSVQDLRKEEPQVFAQLRGLIDQVRGDYNTAGRNRAEELLINTRHLDDQQAKDTAQEKYDKLISKFGSAKPAAVDEHPPKSMKGTDGVEYHYSWNPKTKKYEAD